MDLGNLPKGLSETIVLLSTILTTFTGSASYRPPEGIQPAIATKPATVQTQKLTISQPAFMNSAISVPLEFNNTLPTSEILNATPTATPSPTITPTPTSSPIEVAGKAIQIPAETQIIKAVPTATATPTPTKVRSVTYQSLVRSTEYMPPATSLSSDLIFQMINNHRASKNLPAFEQDEKLCQIAQARAPQLPGEVANGTIHKGFFDMNLPFWATENMAYYQSEQQNMNFWLGSYIHRSAIEGNYTYSCGACQGNACVQIFTNYISK